MGQLCYNSDHNARPKQGGWGDQDEAWIEDYVRFLKGMARARWEKEHPDEVGDEKEEQPILNWREALGIEVEHGG